jgi:hypothetical protein
MEIIKMKIIKMINGKNVKMDDEDYLSFKKHSWRNCKGYAITGVKGIQMHRLVLKAKSGQEVDHINGNPLDNRKSNLRFCTRSQNNMNAKKRNKCTSKYKGVDYRKEERGRNKKWRARIGSTFIGYFYDEISAAKAYNIKAKEIFNNYARLNLIPEGGEHIWNK